jgi:hypothetical protein
MNKSDKTGAFWFIYEKKLTNDKQRKHRFVKMVVNN